VSKTRLAGPAVIAIESLVHRYISSECDRLDLDAFRREVITMVVRYWQPVPTATTS